MKKVTINELIDDWEAQTKWAPQKTKIEYLNKLRELNTVMQDEKLAITPYQLSDGSYTYRIHEK